MAQNKSTTQTHYSAYCFMFAIVLGIVALIFAGFAVAMFGLFAFLLGYGACILAIVDRPAMADAINKVDADEKQHGGAS